MARTTAPLMGFDAEGAIASSIVYAKWRGVRYARRYVIPGNPRTTAQTTTRTTFATLREMWKRLAAGGRAPWDEFARGRPLLGLNAFVGENLRVVRGDANFNDFLGSPGAKGGIPPVSVSAAAGSGSGEVDVTFVYPVIPADWTLVSIEAIAFPQQAPADDFVGPLVVGSEDNPATVVTLAGLGSAAAVVAAGWLKWTKPNGDVAYSVGITDTATAGV